MDAGKPELLARVTNGDCWSYKRRNDTTGSEWKHVNIKDEWLKNKNAADLCDVLCWHDRVAHVAASRSWCQDGAWREVGEVGLDLR